MTTLEATLVPTTRDLGDGFKVRRALPSIQSGSVSVDGQVHERGRLLVFKPATQVLLTATTPARLMVLGGEPLGPRYLWWNFVSSSKERIEQAKQDWKAGRFGGVPGDAEFIPLPQERQPRVDYP